MVCKFYRGFKSAGVNLLHAFHSHRRYMSWSYRVVTVGAPEVEDDFPAVLHVAERYRDDVGGGDVPLST